jgi:hypothetical protein
MTLWIGDVLELRRWIEQFGLLGLISFEVWGNDRFDSISALSACCVSSYASHEQGMSKTAVSASPLPRTDDHKAAPYALRWHVVWNFECGCVSLTSNMQIALRSLVGPDTAHVPFSRPETLTQGTVSLNGLSASTCGLNASNFSLDLSYHGRPIATDEHNQNGSICCARCKYSQTLSVCEKYSTKREDQCEHYNNGYAP